MKTEREMQKSRKGEIMKRGSIEFWAMVASAIGCLPFRGLAQVNTGSNGSDGAFNPISSTVIDMHDHPNGIYQYTSVNIPPGVTVTFIPNANNTPVTWLVQNDCLIAGLVDVSGQPNSGALGGLGGPGGWRGGNGTPVPTAGEGPGGGLTGSPGQCGGNSYLNQFLVPLIGGSGGGGNSVAGGVGGSGGGGAILIAASGQITIQGTIGANSGQVINNSGLYGGQGGGGAIRLVASRVAGAGFISANACQPGRVRLDVYESLFAGGITGASSQGFQPVIIPTAGALPQLTVTSVGGVPVSPNPSGALSTPDAVISSQQINPIAVVVNCVNLPLGTPVTVSVKPMNGPAVSGVAPNSGTLASSTATVSVTMPRGGGLIYATAGTGN
jgi:hypothetical protein